MKSNFNEKINYYQNKINSLVQVELNNIKINNQLIKAIKYSLQNPGKCIRPALVYSTGTVLGLPETALNPIALALELIHSYSLIHDDLPAMDDDKIRRGLNTVHVEFDEATAILAGDAIQTLAFEILARPNPHLTPDKQIKIIEKLAGSAGMHGICSGQALDIENKIIKANSLEAIEQIYKLKTGALIECAINMTCVAAAADAIITKKLNDFAAIIGLAFQIQDDIIETQEQSNILGKSNSSDIRNKKNTYPKAIGLQASIVKTQQLLEEANAILQEISLDTSFLREITKFIINRNK